MVLPFLFFFWPFFYIVYSCILCLRFSLHFFPLCFILSFVFLIVKIPFLPFLTYMLLNCFFPIINFVLWFCSLTWDIPILPVMYHLCGPCSFGTCWPLCMIGTFSRWYSLSLVCFGIFAIVVLFKFYFPLIVLFFFVPFYCCCFVSFFLSYVYFFHQFLILFFFTFHCSYSQVIEVKSTVLIPPDQLS